MLSRVTSFRVGMQNRGMARILQAVEVSKKRTTEGWGRRTKSKNVSDQANDAKVEAAILDILTTAEDQRDGDGTGVTGGQEDDADAGEGVVGGLGTEVDGTEADLDDHAENQGVEGDIKLLVDGLPPARAGDTSITGKGPGAARSGSDTTNTADDAEHQQGDHQAEGTDVVTDGILEDDGGGLVGVDESADGWHHKAERDEEEQTSEEVDHNGADHGLGDHDGGLAHLLTETDNHSSGRGGIGSLQQADEE